MKIAVLVKQVPVVSALRFDPETRRLLRDGVPSEVSAFDVRALVRAVALKQAPADEVVVVTMGPPAARAALLHCLALGADRGVHLVDPAFAGADTLATARALAAALAREACDLVLCGRNSVDAETGQVGPEVAELLGIPQVTAAHRLDLERASGMLRVERETDDGYETVEVRLPALVSAAEDLSPERFPSKAEREAAQHKTIVELTAAALGLAAERVGAAGSPTEVRGLEAVDGQRAGRVIEATSVADAVAILVDELASRGLAGPGTAASDSAMPLPERPRARQGAAYWVLAEVGDGEIHPTTFELIGKAGELASAGDGGYVAAVVMGGPGSGKVADALAAAGADAVYAGEHPDLEPYATEPHTAVLAAAISRHAPTAVLIPSTARGRDLAPRVAARLGLGLTGDCIDLALAGDGRLIQYKPAFGGNVVAPILSRTRPDMATVRPGMLSASRPNPARRLTPEPLDVAAVVPPCVRLVARTRSDEAGAAALATAHAVVGVGKGVGGPEGIGAVRELAAALGAALGATRDVTDLGWLPRQLQIGLTGRAVAPALYVAVGIRGAPEHIVGIRRAGTVVAVNKNPKAPVFKHADLGIIGDFAEVVPALTTALRARRR